MSPAQSGSRRTGPGGIAANALVTAGYQKQSPRQSLDHEIEQRAQASEAPEIAVVADIGVAAGWRRADVECDQPAVAVAEGTRQHCQPATARAKLRLRLPIIAARGDLHIR